MATIPYNESDVEEVTLGYLQELGWAYRFGPELAPDGKTPERASYGQVVLAGRLRAAVDTLNPKVSAAAREEAVRQVLALSDPSLLHANRTLHGWLVGGLAVEVNVDGETRGETVRLVDFADPTNNDLLCVNQFTVIEGGHNRRPDVVCLVNGLPLAVIELKNLADENADVEKAYAQLQTYHQEIPALFRYNAVEVVSDGLVALLGALGAGREHFRAWKTVAGEPVDANASQLATLIRGVFEPGRFLDLIENFVVFEEDAGDVTKKVAQYHQYWAVRKAVDMAVRASGPTGDRKGGVLWHTQGSGKSLTMLWFAGALAKHPALANPTIVVVTDRMDLDDQLCRQFERGAAVLRQSPVQVGSRQELREDLAGRGQGGVVFTTIQKFLNEDKLDAYPTLSERRNIVVLTDEAHRSQYDFVDGYAKNMRDALPNATYVGFTGTPLELGDKVTTAVFGEYIDIYDVQQAVDDGATVPILYEAKQVKLVLPEGAEALLDEGFEEATEAEEATGREKLKTRWAQLEVLVGAEPRIRQVAADLVEHFEGRRDALDGKGMVVCMSRRICVALYEEIVRLRPGWHTDDDATGFLKVVMTGSASDPLDHQPHIRGGKARDALAARFKDPEDELKLVIVRDMWLTGFDVPSLSTMYLDKMMRGHGLMQAIARVNRVFRGKPGGLVVDYIGIANNLREALRTYADAGGRGSAIGNADGDKLDLSQAVNVLEGKLESCRDAFVDFDYSAFLDGTNSQRTEMIPAAMNHVILRDFRHEGTLKRFREDTAALLAAFKLCGSDPNARKHRLEVAFFLLVKSALAKTAGKGDGDAPDRDLEWTLRHLVDSAIVPEGIQDIFALAGLGRPDISVLSEGFLADIREMKQKNLAAEMLRKLLEDGITAMERQSLVQSKRFSERLRDSMGRYHNRAIETAQVIEELIALARELNAARGRGEELGLSDDELAFYDALADNLSAREVMSDGQLHLIAKEVASTVRNNTGIDWTVRESVRANLRRLVKRTLRKYGYPPDDTAEATQTVLAQAELMSRAA